jgi:hypothetical protein
MAVYDELGQYLRIPYYSPDYSSRNSRHEALKAQLYVLGFRLGYRPVLESRIKFDGKHCCVDCLFVTTQGAAVCGIEIDRGAKDKSLAKLRSLPSGVEKIILSFGSDDSWRRGVGKVAGETDIRIFRFPSWESKYPDDSEDLV